MAVVQRIASPMYVGEPDPETLTNFPEYRFLDIAVHGMTMSGFFAGIRTAIRTGQKWLIGNHNLHSLYLCQKEASVRSDRPGPMRRFYGLTKWIQIDGMSLVLLARLHGLAVTREHRLAHNVSLPPLLELARQSNWRVFYLGSSEFIAKQGAEILRARYPGLRLETHHGYFNVEKNGRANQAVLAAIAAFRPNILFVGMGMPRQEHWIEENYDAIEANVILTAGATLDYFAGALPLPPEWVGRWGLEWAYRLFHEPRRLGYRYLVEPCAIAGMVITNRLLGRRAPLEAQAETPSI